MRKKTTIQSTFSFLSLFIHFEANYLFNKAWSCRCYEAGNKKNELNSSWDLEVRSHPSCWCVIFSIYVTDVPVFLELAHKNRGRRPSSTSVDGMWCFSAGSQSNFKLPCSAAAQATRVPILSHSAEQFASLKPFHTLLLFLGPTPRLVSAEQTHSRIAKP